MHKIQNLNDIKMFDTNPEKEIDKFESMYVFIYDKDKLFK